MERFINILTTLCCIAFISSCEEFDIDSIQSPKPMIKSIEASSYPYSEQYIMLELEMPVYPEEDNVYERCKVRIRTQYNPYKYTPTYCFDDHYECEILRSDFTIDKKNKTRYADLTVSLLDKDNNALDTEIIRVSYSYDTSINILSVKGGNRESYNKNGYKYKTEYTIEYELINSTGLVDFYTYLIGNWSVPGIGDYISMYKSKGTYSTSILHGDGNSTSYKQFRGITEDGREIISDKTVKMVNKDGYITFSLVDSSSL